MTNACAFEVPDLTGDGETIDKDATSVIVEWGDGQSSLALRDSGNDCAEGWTWKGGEIVLCDATCAAVNADPLATVTVSLECDNDAIDEIVR